MQIRVVSAQSVVILKSLENFLKNTRNWKKQSKDIKNFSERDSLAWKCKKCRRALFRDTSILPHDEYAKVKSFLKERIKIIS